MHGHLVIADISGYTQFLTSSELDHANGIVGELLNTVIAAIQAPLAVSAIEGDAVFMYGEMPAGLRGEMVIESVERLYFAFASALETMVLNTTCQCNACANIGGLGLKIVMHCGEFVKSDVGGRETLSGPDVILTHRLLKNDIREATGIDEYLFVTQKCVDDLNASSMVASWRPHAEMTDVAGEVGGYVASLDEMWEFARDQNEDKVLQRDAWIANGISINAPPVLVWDALTDPVKRTAWLLVNDVTAVGDARGRIGPGSEYHCAHGPDNEITIFTVLDLRPVDYVTFLVPIDNGLAIRYTDYVVAYGAGTRLMTNTAPLLVAATGETAPAPVLEQARAQVSENNQANLERLRALVEEPSETSVG